MYLLIVIEYNKKENFSMMRKLSASVPLFIFFGLLFIVWAVLWEHKFYLYFAGAVCLFQAFKNYKDKKD